jgi:chemotaxis protein MotB
MDKRKGVGNIWLIIFSDITTNLMLFFLMLFAMTRMTAADKQMVVAGMESTVVNKTIRDEAERDRQLKMQREMEAIQNLQTLVKEGRLAGQANISVDDRKVKISLNPEMFFAIGSAQLNGSTMNALESLVAPLSQFPNDIIVEGHTDNIPIRGGVYRSNWELSIARAVGVIALFVDEGLDAHQLIAGGYGEFHPAFPNDTQENRARNRRIEITIIRQPRSTL